MRKYIAFALAALALFTYTAFADEVMIQKTVYEGLGVVEVEFLRDVQYKDLEVSVQDADGNELKLTVWDRDDDELSFRVKDIVPGMTYNYTISGVRAGFSGEYTAVTGSFSVPEQENVAIKKVDYDFDDRELDVEFYNRVDLSSVEVSIRDEEGKLYDVKIRELDRDGFEAYVPKLEWGASYVLEVGGLAEGSAVFEFVARGD